jgi:CheY-like chemotaxis protein
MTDAKKISVLLVDDDSFLLDIYSTKFREEGVSVQVAFSGTEALALLKKGDYSPDIIVLDIVMPTMDGLEVLQKIKEEKMAPQAKLIMLTNQQEDIERAKEIGADDYIIKANMTPSEVLQQVLQSVA